MNLQENHEERKGGAPLRPLRVLRYPVFFVAGWLFNFVYDVQFLSGFASGWLAHSWIGQITF